MKTFITAPVVFSGNPSNGFDGSLGFRIHVGASPLTVLQLGRYIFPNSSGNHTLQIINPANNAVYTSVILQAFGSSSGGFAYASLATPFVMAAGGDYAIISSENNGGDGWAATTVGGILPSSADATITEDSYVIFPSTYASDHVANQAAMAVNFVYTLNNFVAGNGRLAYVNNVYAELICDPATGGTGPITYQLCRSEDPLFVPSAANAIPGATGLDYQDHNMIPDHVYFYKWIATDATGQTAISGPNYTDNGGGSAFGVVQTNYLAASLNTGGDCVVGLIGDSNTADLTAYDPGANPGSIGDAIYLYLPKLLGTRQVGVVNRAIGGTNSQQWLPGDASGYLVNAVAAFKAASVNIVEINHGTNCYFRTPDQFYSDLLAIITYLFTNMPTLQKVVLSACIFPWYTGRADVSFNLTRYSAFRPVIRSLVDNFRVFLGEMDAWQYIANHPAEASASVGVHLSAEGIKSVGLMRAAGIAKAVAASTQYAADIGSLPVTLAAAVAIIAQYGFLIYKGIPYYKSNELPSEFV